ncbi:hypothetical protein D9615_008966 [Tricholomella constricta]|uniref:Uncharacterized protein n=1 Tax=Tricholomella constricta TaxID=117010 RepID=A0A8H5LYI4_9AGAR|nr:hypothetical protein D9615_008966 [Tricholomella constricta]
MFTLWGDPKENPWEQVRKSFEKFCPTIDTHNAEMTNFYLSAYSREPLIRGAIIRVEIPMWLINDQIGKIAANLGCPTGKGLLQCLRKMELKETMLATGTQFQPVTDNITIWKE